MGHMFPARGGGGLMGGHRGGGSRRRGGRVLPILVALVVCLHGATGHITFRDYVPNAVNIPGSIAIGHLQSHGGGDLSTFGLAFRKAGFKFTKELCLEDSDGDGISNGHELGDPCCLWSMGATPSRSFGLSHPGDIHSITKVPMPDCAAADRKAAEVQDDPEFWKFYYQGRKDQLEQQSNTVADIHAALDRISQRTNNCGNNAGLQKKELCNVCDKCCQPQWQADNPGQDFTQRDCDACTIAHCDRNTTAAEV